MATINGTPAADLLNGTNDNDVISGYRGNNTLIGGAGNDTLIGGIDNDLLSGDNGNDVLYGGRGLNTLTGGAGKDTFAIVRTPGGSGSTDTTYITDFNLGDGDLIGLGSDLTFAQINITQGTGSNATDTLITDKTTGQTLAVVQNVNSTQLNNVNNFVDAKSVTGSLNSTLPETLPDGVRIVELADYGDRPSHYLSSSLYTTLASGRDTNNKFVAFDFLLPAGPNQDQPVGPLPHTHTNELEAFFVVNGTVDFTVGEQTGPNSGELMQVEVGPGTLAYGPQGRVHGFRLKDGTGPGRIFSFALPAGLENFFETAGDQVTNRFNVIPPINFPEITRTAFWAQQRGDGLFIPNPTDPTKAIDGRPVPVFPIGWPDHGDANVNSTDRPTFTGPFGEKRVSLVTPEEAGSITGQVAWKGTTQFNRTAPGGTFDYSYLSLNPQTNFAASVTVPQDRYELLYSLDGNLSLKFDNQDPVTVQPLTYVEIPSGVSYSIANLGNLPADALSISVFNAKTTYGNPNKLPENTRYLFDEQYYLRTNPDVAQAVANGTTTAFDHFKNAGMAEGRNPIPFFNDNYYEATTPITVPAGQPDKITGIEHYIKYGQLDGRNPSVVYNEDYYLANNPDVAQAVQQDQITGIEHYLEFGQFEGRKASSVFNQQFYLQNNPDVAQAVANKQITAIDHFLEYGEFEGRSPSAGYNEKLYLQNNPDVAVAVQKGIFATGIEHYIEYGSAEGRQFSFA